MSEEAKVVSFKDGKVIVKKSLKIDPNKDGEALLNLNLEFELDLSEVADEAVDYWKSRKDKK